MKSPNWKVQTSSEKDDWATPSSVYEDLNREFGFTIDVCASSWNAKHERYYTVADDALAKSWVGEVAFMNPPYGRQTRLWIRKAYEESCAGAFVVGLIPARTDTSYFHDYIYGKAEIRFIRGRLKFERPEGAVDPAPFASMIVIWRPSDSG